MMLVPEPWQQDKSMPEWKRSFYEFRSMQVEPWDGPAFIAFFDGKQFGATLDRNGLRPGRWMVTFRVVGRLRVDVAQVPPLGVHGVAPEPAERRDAVAGDVLLLQRGEAEVLVLRPLHRAAEHELGLAEAADAVVDDRLRVHVVPARARLLDRLLAAPVRRGSVPVGWAAVRPHGRHVRACVDGGGARGGGVWILVERVVREIRARRFCERLPPRLHVVIDELLDHIL